MIRKQDKAEASLAVEDGVQRCPEWAEKKVVEEADAETQEYVVDFQRPNSGLVVFVRHGDRYYGRVDKKKEGMEMVDKYEAQEFIEQRGDGEEREWFDDGDEPTTHEVGAGENAGEAKDRGAVTHRKESNEDPANGGASSRDIELKQGEPQEIVQAENTDEERSSAVNSSSEHGIGVSERAWRELERHPMAKRLPEKTVSEMEAMQQSIKESEGLEDGEKITLFEGKVLDGWSRYEICRSEDFELSEEAFRRLDSEEDARRVLAQKVTHRHLRLPAKCQVAIELALEPEKERARRRQKRGDSLQEGEQPGRATELVAKRFGAARNSLERVLAIKDSAPHVYDDIRLRMFQSVAEVERASRMERDDYEKVKEEWKKSDETTSFKKVRERLFGTWDSEAMGERKASDTEKTPESKPKEIDEISSTLDDSETSPVPASSSTSIPSSGQVPIVV